MIPETEFRTITLSSNEPVDRTTAGTVLGVGQSLDLGSIDTTDEAMDVPVRVIWWRVTDMKGASGVTNVRIYLSDTADYTGTDNWYMDISDTWTGGKTPVQVKTGTPGAAPTSEPLPNLEQIGGGIITGTGHDNTSRYIYITGTIGVNETTGEKEGPEVTVTFDYY